MKESKREELLAKVKLVLPGLLKIVLSVVPNGKTISLVALGTVAVFSVAFPGLIDESTKAILSTTLGF